MRALAVMMSLSIVSLSTAASAQTAAAPTSAPTLIGTTSPSARLHVVGAARVTTDLAVDDDLTVTGAVAIGISNPTATLHVEGTGFVSSHLTISGNVAIGTGTPTAKLHVVGAGRIEGNLTVTGAITADGNLAATFQDVAEWVEAREAMPAGTVVIVDPARDNGVLRSTTAYDARVAGAVSPQPGLILGEGGPDKVMVAQSGRVRVKVDARYGAIRRGDLLVTSPRAGYAMRSTPVRVGGGATMHRPGTVLGKALESLASGTGEILVLLTLQ